MLPAAFTLRCSPLLISTPAEPLSPVALRGLHESVSGLTGLQREEARCRGAGAKIRPLCLPGQSPVGGAPMPPIASVERQRGLHLSGLPGGITSDRRGSACCPDPYLAEIAARVTDRPRIGPSASQRARSGHKAGVPGAAIRPVRP
ncbi:hypothetical protein SKAU_G00043900 [Synaphobranchus kaupii]|uniref:Uncharacterized protein n=1 Tax=Synaphobranchus kaupii TaxID=118154 RepID=A0A9Q1G1U0_SYNKA|nr:hypothetical protein SKAU_G00043900 [Synaphobranchus kaupii]